MLIRIPPMVRLAMVAALPSLDAQPLPPEVYEKAKSAGISTDSLNQLKEILLMAIEDMAIDGKPIRLMVADSAILTIEIEPE